MKILLHADDYGNSHAISDNIIDCMNGALTGISIIPNGYAFDYAMEKFSEFHSDKTIRVHLNLIEGSACNKKSNIALLINEKGYFRQSFMSILLLYYFNRPKRDEIEKQIELEITAQIKKVMGYLPPGSNLQIDSHQHLHMIPFIFEIIINLKKKFPITYIRIPKEKFFLLLERNSIGNYFGANIIKHILLNYLSKKAIPMLKHNGISYPDYFIGVLFTRNVTSQSIQKALKKIRMNKNFSDDATIEVLLHPGGASENEEELWKNYPDLKKFYRSPSRKYEKEVIMKFSGINSITTQLIT